jgi:hypothetical protein
MLLILLITLVIAQNQTVPAVLSVAPIASVASPAVPTVATVGVIPSPSAVRSVTPTTPAKAPTVDQSTCQKAVQTLIDQYTACLPSFPQTAASITEADTKAATFVTCICASNWVLEINVGRGQFDYYCHDCRLVCTAGWHHKGRRACCFGCMCCRDFGAEGCGCFVWVEVVGRWTCLYPFERIAGWSFECGDRQWYCICGCDWFYGVGLIVITFVSSRTLCS